MLAKHRKILAGGKKGPSQYVGQSLSPLLSRARTHYAPSPDTLSGEDIDCSYINFLPTGIHASTCFL